MSSPLSLLLTLLALTVQEARIPADTEVVTTPSGLAYSVLAPGTGALVPAIGDRVRVHYTGWLADGTRVETTRGGEPQTLEVGRALPALNEGLQLMHPGARYKLTVPPELAYGAVGRPPQIPSNATLVFEVELVELVAMPRFRPAGEQRTTPSGLRYEALSPGAGPAPPPPEHVVVVRYAMWDSAGTLLDCSERNNDHRIKGRFARLHEFDLPFLAEAVGLMSVGARYRFEVPPELCFGAAAQPGLPAGSTTVWELELERVLTPLPLPEFEEFDANRLVELASGLEHYPVRAGEGRAPARGDELVLHYVGWLVGGLVVDETYSLGEPARLRLGDQIQGLVEGLQLMQPGGVHFFRIPSDLAYGTGGVPPHIGPRATLIFRVELILVQAR